MDTFEANERHPESISFQNEVVITRLATEDHADDRVLDAGFTRRAVVFGKIMKGQPFQYYFESEHDRKQGTKATTGVVLAIERQDEGEFRIITEFGTEYWITQIPKKPETPKTTKWRDAIARLLRKPRGQSEA